MSNKNNNKDIIARFHAWYNKRLNLGNLSLLLTHLLLIGYSVTYFIIRNSGYYYEPNSKERFLKILVFLFVLLSCGVISPSKKNHTFSIFTFILLVILPIDSAVFIGIILYSYLYFEPLYAFVLCACVVTLVVSAIFGRAKQYELADFFKSKIGSRIKYITHILASMLVVFSVWMLLYMGFNAWKNESLQSFSTQRSADGKYVAKLELVSKKEDEKQVYKVNVYMVKKDKPILQILGKLIYKGDPIASLDIPDRNNAGLKWEDDHTISFKGEVYDLSKYMKKSK